MRTIKPFHGIIRKADKEGLEQFAKEDGIQRGIFFSTSGKLCSGFVSTTNTTVWEFKTTNGQPFSWDDPYKGKLGSVPLT